MHDVDIRRRDAGIDEQAFLRRHDIEIGSPGLTTPPDASACCVALRAEALAPLVGPRVSHSLAKLRARSKRAPMRARMPSTGRRNQMSIDEDRHPGGVEQDVHRGAGDETADFSKIADRLNAERAPRELASMSRLMTRLNIPMVRTEAR
jgi:hypothetical protein